MTKKTSARNYFKNSFGVLTPSGPVQFSSIHLKTHIWHLCFGLYAILSIQYDKYFFFQERRGSTEEGELSEEELERKRIQLLKQLQEDD